MPKHFSPYFHAVRIALIAMLALVMPMLAQPAHAQDTVSEYRLPPSAGPSAQGPVDPDVPAVIRAAPPPEPAPVAATTDPAPPTSAAPQPAPRPQAARPIPAAPPVPAAAVEAQPRAESLPVPVAADPQIAPAAPAQPHTAARPEPDIPFRSALPFAALAIALFLAGAAFALRRKPALPLEEESPPAVIPAPDLATAHTPTPLPRPAFAAQRLTCELAAPSLQLSMLTATLDYRLHLTNRGGHATGPLTVRADLSFAHAELGVREQLDPRERKLEPRHDHSGLAPGEVAELAGKLHLPLAQIRAVRHGHALLFAPLARFIVRSPQGCETFVFTLGEEDPNGGSALVPVRLDHGPRALARLSTRAIDTERWLTLDPVRQAS